MILSKEWLERRSGNNENRKNDHRDPYERDRARMIHSASFRRLQAKTQVLGVGESDFYRTRLTHSLEVAQIGSGIVKQLSNEYVGEDWHEFLPSNALIETICLAHDLGHPPFGHGGEIALNHMMKGKSGFEGNGQTLRIISKLDKYTEKYGMDLTRRSMLGVLKYPVNYSELLSLKHKDPSFIDKNYDNHKKVVAKEWKPPKCYFDEDLKVVEWILEPFSKEDKSEFIKKSIEKGDDKHDKTSHKSFDTTIMDLSDDIAYGIHDLEDAISLKLITRDLWDEYVYDELSNSGSTFNGINIKEIREKLFSTKTHERKEIIGGLVNWLITAVKVKPLDEFDSPLLKYRAYFSEEDQSALNILKDFVVAHVIKSPEVQMLEYKGQQMVMAIFDAVMSDPERLLPVSTKIKWEDYKKTKSCDSGARVVCDYVSGMTDDFATRIFRGLFVAGDGSIFNRL